MVGWAEHGRTETVAHGDRPQFCTAFVLDYHEPAAAAGQVGFIYRSSTSYQIHEAIRYLFF
jgi:hypothetical protein